MDISGSPRRSMWHVAGGVQWDINQCHYHCRVDSTQLRVCMTERAWFSMRLLLFTLKRLSNLGSSAQRSKDANVPDVHA